MNRSKYTTHQDFEWAMKLNRITLEFIGLWPKTIENSRQKLMCNLRVLVVFLALTFGILIPCIHSFIRIYGDVMLMIDNLQATSAALSSTIRITIFWWKIEGIIPIIDMIAEDWGRPKDAQERNIMIRRAQSARLIIMSAYSIMALGCVFLFILPAFGVSIRLRSNITDPGRPLPLQSYYIAIEVIEDTYSIILLALFVYFSILFALCGVRIIALFDEGNDFSLASLVFFVCMVFNIFGHMCLYCALGEFLVAKCDEMYYAAYNNGWYSVDPKLALDLLFVLIRGTKPIYLTAGKMFPITMTTFCNVRYFIVLS
ncbi:PREDICTED: uncharacterized protein LOC105558599 isoform X2 [Vollenhovia emeryi]|uniref:uncharacterized protein LOC105558599 isoform X2 n=1 Tax=Vollenhovia emeryi TaxID=411798 RepID=UPI0005F3F795|nr:PREDICTED: uncharacterized protein LOC105558599 isoform X2 [Vollenhovia emeryi]